MDRRGAWKAVRGVLSDEGGDWDRASQESVQGEFTERSGRAWGLTELIIAVQENPRTPPKVLDLSNELLSHGAVEALADLISVDWGLKKLVLESCGLDDEVRDISACRKMGGLADPRHSQSLRPLLHALLVSGSIPTVSIANNKRIKARGWKYIAVFVRKARFLRYLDVSENTIDKKAADHLAQALTPHFSPISPASTDDVKPKELVKLVELVELEKEKEKSEEDDESEQEDAEPLFTVAPLLKRDDDAPEAATVLSIRLENCGLKGAALEALGESSLLLYLRAPH